MNAVLPTDADVITVARAAMGDGIESAEPLLRQGQPMPRGLSDPGMDVLERTLATGVVRELVRRGGWRRARHVAGQGASAGVIVEGRLWERHPPVGLGFSATSLEVLLWLVEAPLAAKHGRCAASGPCTLGDDVLLYLVGDLLAQVGLDDALADPVFRRSGLCRLAFGLRGAADPGWVDGERAVVLEALQVDLAAKIVQTERRRRSGSAANAVIAGAAAQEAALGALLDRADAAGRRDLVTFAVDAVIAARALPSPALLADSTRSLRERGEVEASARWLERIGERLARWDAEHRTTRFFDDGYELAQVSIRRWEGI